MAITKILSKNMRIDRLIRYVQNPDKTDDAVFTYFQYCNAKDAAQRWQETKVLFGKTGAGSCTAKSDGLSECL